MVVAVYQWYCVSGRQLLRRFGRLSCLELSFQLELSAPARSILVSRNQPSSRSGDVHAPRGGIA